MDAGGLIVQMLTTADMAERALQDLLTRIRQLAAVAPVAASLIRAITGGQVPEGSIYPCPSC